MFQAAERQLSLRSEREPTLGWRTSWKERLCLRVDPCVLEDAIQRIASRDGCYPMTPATAARAVQNIDPECPPQ